MEIKERARELSAYMIDIRRDLHRHPEASFQEVRTTARIAEELTKLGIPYRAFEPTGLLGEIVGGAPGKTLLLRADIDALSIQEKSGVPFASENPGFMHACGHDTHAAMLLGAARILMESKDQLIGTVKLLFQPAEEIARGAKAVIAQGGLANVDAGFGLHIFAQMPPGAIALSAGVSLPAADMFKITLTGKAAHGAMPDMGVDAAVAAAALIMNLQTIVSRELTPVEPVVVTIGTVHAGSRFNIIAGEAVLEGTVRVFNKELHQRIPGIMERIIKETAAAYRCSAELSIDGMAQALVNEEGMTALALTAARKIADAPAMVAPMPRTMGAEDFSDYTDHIPCAFAGLGGGGSHPQHSDYFTIDEDALRTGAALYTQVALDYLS